MTLIMTGSGQFIEVQAGGEEATFTFEQLHEMLKLGKRGIDAILRSQSDCLLRSSPSAEETRRG